MSTPLVSICSITYNHAPFIRQCLDGFLMQRTDFPIEIIINDDCSTDGTTEIIREYAEKYPDKIFPIYQEKNRNINAPFQKFVFPKARGKYIALCEGDDYWTDPLKLQKQVDFLETHPDYSMCFHKAEVIAEEGREYKDYYGWLEEREYKAEELANQFIPTASMIFRATVKHPYHKDFHSADVIIRLACQSYGRAYCMGNAMSVYRLHTGGWTAPSNQAHITDLNILKHLLAILETFPKNHVRPYKRRASLLAFYFMLPFLKGRADDFKPYFFKSLYYCNWNLFYLIFKYIIYKSCAICRFFKKRTSRM